MYVRALMLIFFCIGRRRAPYDDGASGRSHRLDANRLNGVFCESYLFHPWHAATWQGHPSLTRMLFPLLIFNRPFAICLRGSCLSVSVSGRGSARAALRRRVARAPGDPSAADHAHLPAYTLLPPDAPPGLDGAAHLRAVQLAQHRLGVLRWARARRAQA